MDFSKIFMRQGILLGNLLCDRVQGVERFATHPRHFSSQVPPPREFMDLSKAHKFNVGGFFSVLSLRKVETLPQTLKKKR